MLKALAIRNLAVIQTLACEFGPGLNVFTGETGAGKSILLDALGLALGTRADSTLVRTGADRAEITAEFVIAGDGEVAQLLAARGLDADGECILQRQVRADGGSRAFCNGTPVTAQVLQELGDGLVDLHGQHEHQSLLHKAVQRQMIDDYGNHEQLVTRLRGALTRWVACKDQLRQERGTAEHFELERDFLRYQVDELAAQVPDAAALQELLQRHTKVAHATRLLEVCHQQRAAIDDDDNGVGAIVARSLSELRDASRLAPDLPDLIEVAELLASAEAQLLEVSHRLRAFAESLDCEPDELAALELKLGALHDLARKHQVAIEGLPEVLLRVRQRLDALLGAESRIAALTAELQSALADYRAVAADLSAEREKSAGRLSLEVTAHMRTLGMPSGRFEIVLRRDRDADPGPAGEDDCEFRVTTNPDQEPRALAKVASGGELSRIALAIHVAIAGVSGVPVLVYDEVDAGVGGAVAEIVGQRLRDLARHRQVLCITHLPQVACFGEHHYVVTKEVQEGATRTVITPLEPKERISEIARMLGGVAITPTTIRHAEELLARG